MRAILAAKYGGPDVQMADAYRSFHVWIGSDHEQSNRQDL